MMERLRKLNIFERLRVLEEKERERDESLKIMLSNLESIDDYLKRRIDSVGSQNEKLNKLTMIDLDLKSDLDVN